MPCIKFRVALSRSTWLNLKAEAEAGRCRGIVIRGPGPVVLDLVGRIELAYEKEEEEDDEVDLGSFGCAAIDSMGVAEADTGATFR